MYSNIFFDLGFLSSLVGVSLVLIRLPRYNPFSFLTRIPSICLSLMFSAVQPPARACWRGPTARWRSGTHWRSKSPWYCSMVSCMDEHLHTQQYDSFNAACRLQSQMLDTVRSTSARPTPKRRPTYRISSISTSPCPSGGVDTSATGC